MRCRFILTNDTNGLRNDIKSYIKWFPDHVVQFAGERVNKKCDVNFYMEHPVPYFLDDAKINILMCNYEFLTYVKNADSVRRSLPRMHYVICKTKIAKEFCDKLKREHGYGYETVYTRHTTQLPQSTQATTDFINWLHVGGTSPYKNTDVVIQVWQRHPEWPKLFVVCTGTCRDNLAKYVKDWERDNIVNLGHQQDLAKTQRMIQNHICPSMVEGYGHYINEARAYSRFIITTDYPPMNELITSQSGVLAECGAVTPKKSSPGVNSCMLDTDRFESDIARAIATPQAMREKMARAAHAGFIADTAFFTEHMRAFVGRLSNDLKLKL